MLYNIKNFLKVNETKILIIISLILAISLTLYAFPGIFYSDTYQRMYGAEYIIHSELNLTIKTTVTFLPVFFMAMCKKICGNFAVYTLLSAFLYFFISYYAVKKIGIRNRWLQYLLFTLNPILFLVSIWNTPDILCGVMLLCLIFLLSKELKLYDFVLIMLCSMFIFGYKENSYTVLPLILFYIFYNKNWEKIKKVFCLSSILFGIVIVFAMQGCSNVKKIPLYAGGPSWELLNVIEKLPEQKKFEYTNKISSPDKIQLILDKLHENNSDLNGYYWENKYPFSVYNVARNNISKDIINAYIKIAKDYPKEFVQVKMYFIGRILGIKKPLNIAEYDYDRFNFMHKFGFYDSDGRYYICRIFNKYAKYSLIRFPYVLFILSLILLIIAKRIKSDNFSLYLKFYLFAVFYYGAFLITTHSFEIRYFFPSYYLLFMLSISVITELIPKLSYKKVDSVNLLK